VGNAGAAYLLAQASSTIVDDQISFNMLCSYLIYTTTEQKTFITISCLFVVKYSSPIYGILLSDARIHFTQISLSSQNVLHHN